MRVIYDSRNRRLLLLTFYSLLLVASLLAILFLSKILLLSRSSLSDRLTEVSDVIAGGTAVLGVIAGLVALQAYAAATGLPNIEVQVWFSMSVKNIPAFRVEEIGCGTLKTTVPPQQTTATISLRNRSSYSARDPIVIVRASPVLCDVSGEIPGEDQWINFQNPEDSLSAKELIVQWDGGSGNIIHGHSMRRLPPLRLGSLQYNRSWPSPQLEIEVIADGGYRRRVRLCLYLLSEDGSECQMRMLPDNVPEWL